MTTTSIHKNATEASAHAAMAVVAQDTENSLASTPTSGTNKCLTTIVLQCLDTHEAEGGLGRLASKFSPPIIEMIPIYAQVLLTPLPTLMVLGFSSFISLEALAWEPLPVKVRP